MCFAEESWQFSEERSRTTDLRAVRGGSPISTGFAGKVGGEASSTSLISSGTAAKVGMVDGAESHAESHGSAAPIAGGVVASIRNSLMPLGPEGEEMVEAAHKARILHFLKLAETGVCNRPDGELASCLKMGNA